MLNSAFWPNWRHQATASAMLCMMVVCLQANNFVLHAAKLMWASTTPFDEHHRMVVSLHLFHCQIAVVFLGVVALHLPLFVWASANHMLPNKWKKLPHILLIVVADMDRAFMHLIWMNWHKTAFTWTIVVCCPAAVLLKQLCSWDDILHQVIEPNATRDCRWTKKPWPKFCSKRATKHMPSENGMLCIVTGKWRPPFVVFNHFLDFMLVGKITSVMSMGRDTILRWDQHEFCGKDCSQIADARGNCSTHVCAQEVILLIDEWHRDAATTRC